MNSMSSQKINTNMIYIISMLIPKFIEENKHARIVEKIPQKKNGELTGHKKLELFNSMVKQE